MGHKETFARNLRDARKRAGLSQEALGDLTGVHRTEVSKLERAASDPRLSTIVRLARGLEVEVAELIDGVR